MSSAKRQPFCLGHNLLTTWYPWPRSSMIPDHLLDKVQTFIVWFINNFVFIDHKYQERMIPLISYLSYAFIQPTRLSFTPDSKVHWANMGPTWVLLAPDGPHVAPMNLAMTVYIICLGCQQRHCLSMSVSIMRWAKPLRCTHDVLQQNHTMIASWHGNTFRVTGSLWGNPPVTGEFP